MSILTPPERRGAWLIAAVLIVGTAWDLLDTRFPGPRAFDHRRGLILETHATSADTVANASGIVDLNQASAGELRGLPGIGPVLARRIIAYRETHGGFRGVEELLAVRGIGPALYTRVQGRLRVSPHR